MKYLSTCQGFTVPEQVIVLLMIIGILALVGLPYKKDYTDKMRNLEPLSLTSPVMVDGIERQLKVGSVVIGNPNNIERDEIKKVYVVLDVKKEMNDLFLLLPSEYQRHGEKVKVSNRMQAILNSQYFDINSETPEIQAVETVKSVKWEWSIKPKPESQGDCELAITLSALINLQGQSTPKVLNTYSRKIVVSVSTSSIIWVFFQENMGWLWAPTSIIVGFIWSLFFRPKSAK